MSKKTNATAAVSAPTRVTPDIIQAAAAAFPAGRTGVRNVFGGHVGSKATLWDYALVATPQHTWHAADVRALAALIDARGIKPLDANGFPKVDNNGLVESYADRNVPNPQHTAEHAMPVSADRSVQPTGRQKWLRLPDGTYHTRAVLYPDGTCGIDPAFAAHCQTAGVSLAVGYPTLPLQSGPAPKASSKASSKAKAGSKATPPALPAEASDSAPVASPGLLDRMANKLAAAAKAAAKPEPRKRSKKA